MRFIGDNFNQAQRVARVGSWKYDLRKDECYGTEEIFRIYGIAPAEFNNGLYNAIKLAHPKDQYKLKDAMEKSLKGLSCQFEYRIPQSDGTTKYVLGKGEPIFDKEQRVIGVIGTLQDISEKKLIDEALEMSNKNLKRAQEIASIGSWELDLIHNKSYWSDEAYKIYGITPEQYDNTYGGFLKFVYPDDIEIIENYFSNPPKEPYDMEFRIVISDGSVRNIFQRLEFVFDKEDKPIFVYGTIHDITEKKKLQMEIERKQKEINKIQRRLQVLIQESNDVFEILAPDGTIMYLSEASEKVIGFKPEERIGKKVYEYYRGKDLQKMHEMMDSVLSDPNQKPRVMFV